MGQSKLNSIFLPDEVSCEKVAADLYAQLPALMPADRALVIFLSGTLGAGKTTFARGLLRAAGISGAIRSPTYTLIETYEIENMTFVHIDLYRLDNTVQAHGLGLREYDSPGMVWLVEWPDRLVGLDCDLRLELTHQGEGRQLGFTAGATAGTNLLKNWPVSACEVG